MKSVILTAFLAIATSFAHATGFTATPVTETATAVEKSQVNIEELPEGVIRTLDGARFTGWKPVVAYKVKAEDRSYYEITFVRGDEMETLKLNSEGGKIG